MEKKKPVDTVKRGRLEAAIWENGGKDGPFYQVTFNRRYHDGTGVKSSPSFGRQDLRDVALLAIKVEEELRKRSRIDDAASTASEPDDEPAPAE